MFISKSSTMTLAHHQGMLLLGWGHYIRVLYVHTCNSVRVCGLQEVGAQEKRVYDISSQFG